MLARMSAFVACQCFSCDLHQAFTRLVTSTTKPLPTQIAGLGGCTGRATVATESAMELPSNCSTSSGGLGSTLMVCAGTC